MAENFNEVPDNVPAPIQSSTGELAKSGQVVTDTTLNRGGNVLAFLRSINSDLENTGAALGTAFAPIRPFVGKMTTWFSGTTFEGTADTVTIPHGYSSVIDYRADNDKYVQTGIAEADRGNFKQYSGLADTGYFMSIFESSPVAANTVLQRLSYRVHDNTIAQFDTLRRTAEGKIEWNNLQPAVPATTEHDIQSRVNMDYPTAQSFHGLSATQSSFEMEFDETEMAAAHINPDNDIELFVDLEYVIGSRTIAFSLSTNFLDADYDDATHLPNVFDWEDKFAFNEDGNTGTIQHRVYDNASGTRTYALRYKPNTGGRQSDFQIRVRAGLTPYVRYYVHTSNAIALADNWQAVQTSVGNDLAADDGTLRIGYQDDPTTDGVHSRMYASVLASDGTVHGVDVFEFSHIRVLPNTVEFHDTAVGSHRFMCDTNETKHSRGTTTYFNPYRQVLGIEQLMNQHWNERWWSGLIHRVQNPDKAELNFDVDLTGGHKLQFDGIDFPNAPVADSLIIGNAAGDAYEEITKQELLEGLQNRALTLNRIVSAEQLAALTSQVSRGFIDTGDEEPNWRGNQLYMIVFHELSADGNGTIVAGTRISNMVRGNFIRDGLKVKAVGDSASTIAPNDDFILEGPAESPKYIAKTAAQDGNIIVNVNGDTSPFRLDIYEVNVSSGAIGKRTRILQQNIAGRANQLRWSAFTTDAIDTTEYNDLDVLEFWRGIAGTGTQAGKIAWLKIGQCYVEQWNNAPLVANTNTAVSYRSNNPNYVTGNHTLNVREVIGRNAAGNVTYASQATGIEASPAPLRVYHVVGE